MITGCAGVSWSEKIGVFIHGDGHHSGQGSSMKRVRRTLGIVALALVLLYVAVQSYNYVDLRGPVYTVAQIQIGLQNHPHAWTGRSVLVRGVVSSRGFSRDCSPTGCQSTIVYEELGAPEGLIVEIPWYHYPGALSVVASENRQVIQRLPGPLHGLVFNFLDPNPPHVDTIQRIRLRTQDHCPTFTSVCPVAVLEH